MDSAGILKLFVYGSLRSGFRSPAYEYISRYFDFSGEARVKGVLYDMGDYPAAKPFNGERYIVGELYTAREADEFEWAIGQLDDYEGTSTEGNEDPLYRRNMAEIYLGNEVVPAWIYWYTGDVAGRPEIPSGDLLEYMKNRK